MKLRTLAMIAVAAAAAVPACGHQQATQEKPGLTMEEFNRLHEEGLKEANAERVQMVQNIRNEFGLDDPVKPIRLELRTGSQEQGCYLTKEKGCYVYKATDKTDAEAKGRELIYKALGISKEELDRDYCVLISSGDFEFGGKQVFDDPGAPIGAKVIYFQRTNTTVDALKAAKQNSSYEIRFVGEVDEEEAYANFAYILELNSADARSHFTVTVDAEGGLTLATLRGR